jgi:hypothetical protein
MDSHMSQGLEDIKGCTTKIHQVLKDEECQGLRQGLLG